MSRSRAWHLLGAVAVAVSGLLPAPLSAAKPPPPSLDSYSDKGMTIRFVLDREGHVTGCAGTTFGDPAGSALLKYRPPENMGCTERTPAEMTAVIGQPATNFSAIELRVAMLTEGGTGNAPPVGYSARRLLTSSMLEIARDGTVTGCTTRDAVTIGATQLDFCRDKAKVGEKQFRPAATNAPRRMTVSVEVLGWPQPVR